MIEWANQHYNIKKLALIPILNQVIEVKNKFDDLTFTHIFQDFNTQADNLYIDSLRFQESTLTEHAFGGGTLLSAAESVLY